RARDARGGVSLAGGEKRVGVAPPVVPPGEPLEERAVLDVLASLAGVEWLLLVHYGSHSESELGVPERWVHAVHRAAPGATRVRLTATHLGRVGQDVIPFGFRWPAPAR